jgi:hypothetical protein
VTLGHPFTAQDQIVASAIVGTIATAVEVTGFWRTLGVIFIGISVSIFPATLPIALGQLTTAIADMGDAPGLD